MLNGGEGDGGIGCSSEVGVHGGEGDVRLACVGGEGPCVEGSSGEGSGPDVDRYYQASITFRTKIHFGHTIIDALNAHPSRLELFRSSCFGAYLQIPKKTKGDPGLIHILLQKQIFLDDDQDDVMRFNVGGHRLTFGPKEFCLISGLRFGDLPASKPIGTHAFRRRVLPHIALNEPLRVQHLKPLLAPTVFAQLDDVDGVRVCLLLMVTICFIGYNHDNHIDAYLFELIEDLDEWNRYPWGTLIWKSTGLNLKNALQNRPQHQEIIREGEKEVKYTLLGFVYIFKIWIFETFPIRAKEYSDHLPGILPRALSWSWRKLIYWRGCLSFLDVSGERFRPRVHLTPTAQEQASTWWTESRVYFDRQVQKDKGHFTSTVVAPPLRVPRSPPRPLSPPRLQSPLRPDSPSQLQSPLRPESSPQSQSPLQPESPPRLQSPLQPQPPRHPQPHCRAQSPLHQSISISDMSTLLELTVMESKLREVKTDMVVMKDQMERLEGLMHTLISRFNRHIDHLAPDRRPSCPVSSTPEVSLEVSPIHVSPVWTPPISSTIATTESLQAQAEEEARSEMPSAEVEPIQAPPSVVISTEEPLQAYSEAEARSEMLTAEVERVQAPTSVAMFIEESLQPHPETEARSKILPAEVEPIQASTSVAISTKESLQVHPEGQAPTSVAMSVEASLQAHPEVEGVLVVGASRKRKEVEHTTPLALAKEKRGEHTSWMSKSPSGEQPPTTSREPTKAMRPLQKKKKSTVVSKEEKINLYGIYISKGSFSCTICDIPAPKKFWGELLGQCENGWLTDNHINIFVQLLLKLRNRNERWTAVYSIFEMLLQIDGAYTMADGTSPFKPWWKVDRVFIPLCVRGKHWVIGVLDLQTFTITIYDSEVKQHHRQEILELVNGIVLLLPKFLDEISYWVKSRYVRPSSLNIKVEYRVDVPVQASPLGDCGVLVCMYMASFARGQELDVQGDVALTTMEFRHSMANMFWDNRDIKRSS